MGAIERVERLTLEEFSRLYEQGGPFEFIDSARRALTPPVALHGLMIRALFRLLDAFCTARALGEVITRMPFVQVYDANWVKGTLVPDVMFFAANHWQQYIKATADWKGNPFVLIPDLAVEVVSPNDLYTDIQDKVARSTGVGVRLIWVVDPQRSRVTAYEGEHYGVLGQDDTLTGGEVIPGLAINLRDMFKLA